MKCKRLTFIVFGTFHYDSIVVVLPYKHSLFQIVGISCYLNGQNFLYFYQHYHELYVCYYELV